MNSPEETRQQLWDLIYGLLSPEEAQALSAKITSEPDVARAYAEAKLRTDLLAAAAKLEEARLPLGRPHDKKDDFDLELADSEKEPVTPARRWSAAQVVNLLAGLAALALLAYAGFGYAQSTWGIKAERDVLAQKFVRIVAVGPEVVSLIDLNHYSVNTLALDGTQTPADVKVSVVTNGEVMHDEIKGWADDNGVMNYNVPGNFLSDQSKVVFEAEGEGSVVSLAIKPVSRSAGKDSTPEINGKKWYLAEAEVDGSRPVELEVPANRYRNLVVSAENGGHPVGQQLIAPPADDSTELARLSYRQFFNLDPKSSGATRVRVHDYNFSPPAPVSERFFYVLPSQKLSIKCTNEVDVYAPGDEVQIQFKVLGANEEPVAAILNVAVVEDEVLVAHSGRTKAAESQIALANDNDVKVNALASTIDSFLVLSDSNADVPLPQVEDNSLAVQRAYQEEVREFDLGRAGGLQWVGQITLAGGVILVVGLLSLALLSRIGDARIWLPPLAAAALCLLVGGLWMTARVDEEGQMALAPFTSTGSKSLADRESLIAQNQSGEAGQTASSELQSSKTPGVDGLDFTSSDMPYGATADPSTSLSGLDSTANSGRNPGKDVKADNSANKPRTSGKGGAATAGQASGQPAGSGGSPDADNLLGVDFSGSSTTYTARPLATIHTLGGEVDSVSRDMLVFVAEPQLTANEDGLAAVNFKLPPKAGVYRVFVEGRAGESLGLYRGTIVARELPAAASEAKKE